MIIYSIDYYGQDQDCTQCGRHSNEFAGGMFKTTYSYGKQVYIPDYKSRERSFVSGF